MPMKTDQQQQVSKEAIQPEQSSSWHELLDKAVQPFVALPERLLSLSAETRLGIIIGTFLLATLLYGVTIILGSINANIMCIPVALAVWLFRRRGAVSSVLLALLLLAIGAYYQARLYGIRVAPLGFGLSGLALIIVACIIYYLRMAVYAANSSRRQALQAQQQTILAFEQQRQAYEQQLHLNQMKDQFLLNVNHELRTPLTELYGYLELLQVFQGQIDTAMHETFLNLALQGCEELQRLITHIMDAIQVGSNVKAPANEEIFIAQAAQELIEHLDPRKQQEYQFHIEIAETLTVWADPLYLRQIMRNLLSNAMKYSPLHSSITISAVPYEKETVLQQPYSTPFVRICVQDTGPGIPPKELPLLFGKFVRLQRDISGTVRGAGLGLYISKQLVDAMEGHIWAESAGIEGQGSRFYFTLPQPARAQRTEILPDQKLEESSQEMR